MSNRLAFLMLLLAMGCSYETNLSTSQEDDGTDDTEYLYETDWDSDGQPDGNIDTSTIPQQDDTDTGGGDGDADSDADGDTDEDTDTSPWSEPVQKQSGLVDMQIDCPVASLTSDCADNAPSPCVPDEPKIICDFSLADEDSLVVYDGVIGIERRGRSSMQFHKPNYSMEFRMSDGVTDNPMPCLGMGKEADWILDGAWMDRSFLRNDLVFDIFREIGGDGRYAPESRFGTLSFNGAHRGIYRLVERIKKDDDRIAIADDNNTGSSFVIKQDDDGSLYDSIGMEYNTWQLIYPNKNRASAEQRSGVQSWLSDFSDAMKSGRAFDYLDMETTVDYVLLQEFSKNIDAFKLSIHIYKDLTGKAHLVPWDIDLSFGQPTIVNDYDNWNNEEPTGWISDRTNFNGYLQADDEFRARLASRWAELRTGPLSNAWIDKRIEDMQMVLTTDALNANFAVFPLSDVDFNFIFYRYTIYDVSSYADELSHLKQFIQTRLIWIDANIPYYPQ